MTFEEFIEINNAHPNRKFCPNCGQALDWR